MGGNSRGLQKSFDVHAPGSRGLNVVFAVRVFGIGFRRPGARNDGAGLRLPEWR
jgi:hypothetical protein